MPSQYSKYILKERVSSRTARAIQKNPVSKKKKKKKERKREREKRKPKRMLK